MRLQLSLSAFNWKIISFGNLRCLKYIMYYVWYRNIQILCKLDANWKLLALFTEWVHLILIEKGEFQVLFVITKKGGWRPNPKF